MGDGAQLTGCGPGHCSGLPFGQGLGLCQPGRGPGSPGNTPPPSLPHCLPSSFPPPYISASHLKPWGYLFKMQIPLLVTLGQGWKVYVITNTPRTPEVLNKHSSLGDFLLGKLRRGTEWVRSRAPDLNLGLLTASPCGPPHLQAGDGHPRRWPTSGAEELCTVALSPPRGSHSPSAAPSSES